MTSILLYFIIKKKHSVIYITIPLYGIVIISSTLTPIYLDVAYGFLINYFILLTIFSIYYLNFRDKYLLIYGFTYLLLYFYTCIIPYVVTDCTVYSLTCLYTRVFSVNILEYVVFTTGLLMLILLNSIVSQYDRFEYSLFHIITLIYSISHYVVLLKTIPNFLYSVISIVIALFIYSTSKYIGYYIFSEEESVEEVFDKYVTINTLFVFISLAISLIYSTIWG